jgi:hypothetical protein
MRVLVLSVLLAAPAAAFAPSAELPPPADEARQDRPARSERCLDVLLRKAERDAVPPRPRRLGNLPPAQLELAVLLEENGCPVRAVLREGIGGRD